MKKVLLCMMFVMTILIGCDKEETQTEENQSTTIGYTLTITPATVTIGDDITLTLSGDNLDEMVWLACYSSADGYMNSCLITPFIDGKIVYSTSGLAVGEYTFYASCDDLKSTYASVTITQ